MPPRQAWPIVAGGAVVILLGAGLSATVSLGFIPLGLLGGLAFALGLCGLSERTLVALPAFVVGLGATFLLTFGGHAVLMDRIGHVERCTVTTRTGCAGPRRRCGSGRRCGRCSRTSRRGTRWWSWAS